MNYCSYVHNSTLYLESQPHRVKNFLSISREIAIELYPDSYLFVIAIFPQLCYHDNLP